MDGALQPASVPPEFLEQVKDWADGQPSPVSVILFGSRARGDYDAGSDWDFAVVYEGVRPPVRALPRSLNGDSVDWVPLERVHALRWINLCGVQHAVASSGVCLLGDPLPIPERCDVNHPMTWHFLVEAHKKAGACLDALIKYWSAPEYIQVGHDTDAADRSSLAGECLCKAVLHGMGHTPQKSHSVSDLCRQIQSVAPHEELLPALEACNDDSEAAHKSAYSAGPGEVEDIDSSTARLCDVMIAAEMVLTRACDSSSLVDAGLALGTLLHHREAFAERLEDLSPTDCPASTVDEIREHLAEWSADLDLWNRLSAPVPTKAQGRATRGPARRRAAEAASRSVLGPGGGIAGPTQAALDVRCAP